MMLAAARCKCVIDGSWGKMRYLDVGLLDRWDKRA